MSNKYNDELLEKAFEIASDECDVSCPGEIVMEKAKEIYETLSI